MHFRKGIKIMLKAYKYRIYPNVSQKNLLGQHFGTSRWVYNWALENIIRHYEKTGKYLSRRTLQDTLVALKKDTEWLKEVNSQSLLATLMHVEKAFRKFFRKQAGFPQFKKKYSMRQSYQCPQHVQVDADNNRLHLPKIKNIKIRLHRAFDGVIKTCTISRTSTDKYFISILVDTPDVAPPLSQVEADKTIGIDLGIKDFVITSSGIKEPNHKYLYKSTKRLERVQRRFSKKCKGSASRGKERRNVAKIHEKVTNQRKKGAHKVSAHLVYKNQDTSFALEDLNVSGMMKNHKLARAIGDCGWHFFTKTLQYKATWAGKNVIFIDRWFPSSKICSQCGTTKKELSLAMRTYTCNHCHMHLDRDINAAINIKNAALTNIGLGQPNYKPVDHALTGAAILQSSYSWGEAGSRHQSVSLVVGSSHDEI